MTVYSMTGYANVQSSNTPLSLSTEISSEKNYDYQLSIEIRSVNSRFLDLNFKLSEELRSFEHQIRERILTKLKRGKIEFKALIELNTHEVIPEPHIEFLQRIQIIQNSIRASLPDAKPLTVADILRLSVNETKIYRDWTNNLLPTVDEALVALLDARKREGDRLRVMLLERITQLRDLVHKIAPLIPKLVSQQRQRFIDRWREAMDLNEGSILPEMAQDRALSEATAYAIKIDVAEEITRLHSHLDELERLIKKEGKLVKGWIF